MLSLGGTERGQREGQLASSSATHPHPGSHLGIHLPSETLDPGQALSAFLKPGTIKELGFVRNDLVLQISNLQMVL